jgi:hypothetical protein
MEDGLDISMITMPGNKEVYLDNRDDEDLGNPALARYLMGVRSFAAVSDIHSICFQGRISFGALH